MDQLWARIGYLHYRDLVGRRSPEALGDGTLDFEAIGQFATSRGFSGWAVVELDSAVGGYTRTPLENVRISCEIMRRTLGVPR